VHLYGVATQTVKLHTQLDSFQPKPGTRSMKLGSLAPNARVLGGAVGARPTRGRSEGRRGDYHLPSNVKDPTNFPTSSHGRRAMRRCGASRRGPLGPTQPVRASLSAGVSRLPTSAREGARGKAPLCPVLWSRPGSCTSRRRKSHALGSPPCARATCACGVCMCMRMCTGTECGVPVPRGGARAAAET